MKKTEENLYYPENAYADIFGEPHYHNLPADAEESLEYVFGMLSERETDILLLRYRDEMTLEEIAMKKDGITRERARQILAKALRKIRHPSRSRILLYGREIYLNVSSTKRPQ